MNTDEKTNNQLLRDLVVASGLSQAMALTVFNRGLGPAAYSASTWKAFFVRPDSDRFRPLSDKLLVHATKQFSKVTNKA